MKEKGKRNKIIEKINIEREDQNSLPQCLIILIESRKSILVKSL